MPSLRWVPSIVAATIALSIGSVVYFAVSLSAPEPAQSFGPRGFPLLFAACFGVTGVILVRARPQNAIGWLCLIGAFGASIQAFADAWTLWAVGVHASTSVPARIAATSADYIWYAGFGSLALAMALFPDGRPISRRWGRWLTVCVVGTVLTVVTGILTDRPLIYPGTANPMAVPGMYYATSTLSVSFFLLLISSFVSLVVRRRRASGDEREQLRWIVSSIALVVATFAIYFIAYSAAGGNADTTAANALEILIVISVLTIPVAIAVGILKYRLYDIDVVISKTLVYGVLAAAIAGVYVAIVVGVGTMIGSTTSPFLSAVAAAFVAIVFQPARRRLQRIANRFVYGERATPYEVLSEFADRLATSYSVDDVLPRLVRLVADGTGAETVGVWLRVGAELQPAAVWPEGQASIGPDAVGGRVFDVRHQGEPLGAIVLRMPAGAVITSDQERLVNGVASQAGLVLRNVGLI
ncbi:MAG: hypothetical protein ABI572_08505, partial [Actinomycetota bacterium]